MGLLHVSTFRLWLIPGADVQVGLHPLYGTSVCKGSILPYGEFGICIGFTGHYWE